MPRTTPPLPLLVTHPLRQPPPHPSRPSAGLLRVREFQQAEIEHFCHPDKKDHPKFHSVKDVVLPLYARENQMALTSEQRRPTRMALGEAVERGIIANQTLGYFIGRTYQFFCMVRAGARCEWSMGFTSESAPVVSRPCTLSRCPLKDCSGLQPISHPSRASVASPPQVGIDPARVRFRQHLAHEMAHYACDCWDGEIETTYGWVECCGLADRSAYDLTKHSEASKVDLSAFEAFDEPITVEELRVRGRGETGSKQLC